MNPLTQGHSGTTPETSRKALSTNQGTNEDDLQIDSHPEAGIFHNQMTQNSGPEDDLDMVTGATEQIHYRHGMLTGVHGEVAYSSQVHLQESRKRTAQPVNCNSAVRKPLRRSKQTKFRRPLTSWQTTTILQTFIITSTEFPNFRNHLSQRCPRLTGNRRSMSCLRNFSK